MPTRNAFWINCAYILLNICMNILVLDILNSSLMLNLVLYNRNQRLWRLFCASCKCYFSHSLPQNSSFYCPKERSWGTPGAQLRKLKSCLNLCMFWALFFSCNAANVQICNTMLWCNNALQNCCKLVVFSAFYLDFTKIVKGRRRVPSMKKVGNGFPRVPVPLHSWFYLCRIFIFYVMISFSGITWQNDDKYT